MYLIYNKQNNKVIQINEKPFVFYNKNLYNECYVEELPMRTTAQYWEVVNVREETKIIKEAYSEEEVYWNEETEQEETRIVEFPAITKTYLTCDIVVKDRPQPNEEVKAQMLAKRNALKEIEELKQKLKDTDYQAIKFAEGFYSIEEYAPIKAQRQSWRDKINELEMQAKVYGN